MTKDNEYYLKTVNGSGFPLQIALQNQINKTTDTHGWKVLSIENPWKDAETQREGFIDLVLIHWKSTMRIVIECKRRLDTEWIFLHPSPSLKNRSHSRVWRTHVINDNTHACHWTDCQVEPSTPETAFCVMPGGKGERSILEHTASELIEATEAFAIQEYSIHRNRKHGLVALYFPLIVTTATLKVCTFDPHNVSMETGEIANTASTAFTTVPAIRFRKSLSVKDNHRASIDNISDAIQAREMTVFVVNAANLLEVLKDWEIIDRVYNV